MLLYQILAYTIHGKIFLKSYKNNKLKISGPTLNDKLELPDGQRPASDIQNYFECIIKIHETLTDNPPIGIYVKKIESRIIFKFKTRYHLEFLMSETMKLLGSYKNKITKDKNGENVPHLKVTAVVLAHCNIASNDYQHNCMYICHLLRSRCR